jgi:hypothetical protein
MLSPVQTAALAGEMEATREGLTLTVLEAVAEQPLALVTVTE